MATSFFNNNCEDEVEELESAKQYADLARDWAIKMDGLVDGIDFSSKYWAQQSAEGAGLSVTVEEDGTPLGQDFTVFNFGIGVSATQTTTNEVLIQSTGQVLVETFDDGVGFIAGTSEEITLATEVVSKNNIDIYFDGQYQNKETYDVSGVLVTFDSIIPVGVSEIEVVYPRLMDVGVAAAENVTFDGSNVDVELVSLRARVTTNESDISSLEGRVTTAEAEITGLDGRITTAESDIVSLDGRLTIVERSTLVNRPFPNVAAVGTATFLLTGDFVEWLGYYTPGDGGSNKGEIGTGFGPADNGSVFDLIGSGLQARGLFPGHRISILQFGAVSDGNVDGSTNDVVAVRNASNFAYLNGYRFVHVERDTYVFGDVPNKANVIFVGEGRFGPFVNSNINNIGIYRRQVVTESAKPARAYPDNMQKIGVRNPAQATVVFFGDSLSTYAANSTSSSNTKSAYFERMIRASNPDTEFTFYNRSIGGEGSVAMNSRPDPLPAGYEWYTNPLQDWLEYIYDLDPDIVVMATGMNEGPSFDPQDIYDIRAKIEANTNAAIVFVADYVPTLSPVGVREGVSFAWYNAQEWRDRAAGFIRSYANELRYPLIDLNRTFAMVRDGMDILSQRYVKSDEYILSDGQFTVVQTGAARAFTLRAVFEAGCFTNPDPVTVSLDEGSQHRVWIRESGGFLTLRFLDREFGNVDYTTDLPTPVGDNEYEIVVTQTSFSIRDVTTGSRYARFEVDCVKRGGLWAPVVDYFAQATGPIVSVTGFYPGQETDAMPTVTDVEFFGFVESGFENAVTGGDGQVHPSTFGLEALHGAHYSEQNFRLVSRAGNTITVDVNGSPFEFNYKPKADGSFFISGSGITDGSGVATLTFPISAPLNLREYTTVSAWRTGGGTPFVALVNSGGSSVNTLEVNTYDMAGVAAGSRSFTFVINAS